MSTFVATSLEGSPEKFTLEEQHLSVVSKPSSEAPDALEFDSGSSEVESSNEIKLKMVLLLIMGMLHYHIII